MSYLVLCLLDSAREDCQLIMNKFALTVLFMLLASPTWATTYYLAPASGGGNDSNNGASVSSPWLTPNHPVNCGDVIMAVPSTDYSSLNFASGQWGTVTCPSGNNVAWLKCATFDACKINSSSEDAIAVSSAYWGVQGWEVTTSGVFAGCFSAKPTSNATPIHHIIFANNVANGCSSGGVVAYPGRFGNVPIDYLIVIGNIVYNSAQDGSFCYSGISIFRPLNFDTLPGTHIYIAGNLTYNNVEPSPCGGGIPTDGEGVLLDSFGFNSYSGQTVVDNNIAVQNGRAGFATGGSGTSSALIYFRNNTAYGNNISTSITNTQCGGDIMLLGTVSLAQIFGNISRATSATGCDGSARYALFVYQANGTDQVYSNWAYGIGGNSTGILSSPGFSYDTNNTLGIDPAFANAIYPPAPNCGAFADVPHCMATVIANFTPTVVTAKAYGRQPIQPGYVIDPLFPQWLCKVNLPAGLVTMGCQTGAAPPTLQVAGVT
jgi:hypothetical protein